MTVILERESGEKVVTEEDNIQVLTKLFMETKPDKTPQVIHDIVELIDKIAKATWFEGWQDTQRGKRDIQKTLVLALAQFGLGKDKELFD